MLAATLNQSELLIASRIERFLVPVPHLQPGDLDPPLKRHLRMKRIRLPRGGVASNLLSLMVAFMSESLSSIGPFDRL